MNAQDVIERLCLLQHEVWDGITDHTLRQESTAADCFCGKGGFWGQPRYDGTEAHGYRNDGVALAFIEDAVRAALRERHP